MRELLEKWVEFGEKAPAWDGMVFRVLPPLIDNRWNIAHSGQTFQMEHPEVQGHHILAATIEAIDSHKWTWSLQGPRKSRAEHMGFVYHPKREDGPPWKVRSGDTPAEALLAAYLAAIEAEAA